MNKKDKAYIESLVGDINRKMPDYDGDGYPDLFDCDPFDPTKDGLIGDAWARMTGAATRAQQAARRVYAPAAAQARQTAAQATARVRASAAAAQRRVVAHRRAGVVRAAAIKARPPPKPRVDIVKAYKETERRVSEIIPSFREIAVAGAEFGERPAIHRAYQRVGERVLGLPEPIKAVGVETFKFTRGAYKEFQQYPVTTAAKTAAFAVAGPAIRGVGLAATAGRVAIAAKAPTFARIPGVGPALVTTGRKAAWIGEKAAKYAMPAVGALWAGSVAQRVYKTPAELRAEEAGRIFMAEVAPMTGGAAIAQEAAMFRHVGIPRWKPPSIKKVKEVKDWKPPVFEKPPTTAELPAIRRLPVVERPPAIEPITISPKPGVTRKIQLRDELIELEAHPPRSSALFGTKAQKAEWIKYNKKVASIKSEIKRTEVKEITSAREKEIAEAEKWTGAEREWVAGTGVPITPPTPPAALSLRVRLNRQLIELEAAPPRGSRLYGTSAQKKAFKSYDKKVSDVKRKIKDIDAKEAKEIAAVREKELVESAKWREAEAEFVTPKEPITAAVRKVKKEPPVRKPKEKTVEDEWKEAEATYKAQFEAPTPVSAVVKEPPKPKDVFAEAKKASEGRIKKRLVEEKRLKEEFGDVAMGGAPGRRGTGQQLLLRQEVKAVQKVKLKQEQKLVQKQKQAVKQKVKQEQKQEQKYKIVTAGEQMTRTMQAAEVQRQKQLADMMKPIALQKQKPAQIIVPFVGYKPMYDVPQVPREVAIPKVTHVPRTDQAQKYRTPPPPTRIKTPPIYPPPPPPPVITPIPKIPKTPPPPIIPFMMDGGIGGAAAVRAKRKRAWKQRHKLITLESLLGYKI